MDTQPLADQQRLTFIWSVWTLDAIWRANQGRQPIGTDIVKGLRESTLFVRFDNDDEEDYDFFVKISKIKYSH